MAWIDMLVSKSPIKPMQQHMGVAVLCAREILPLLDAMAEGDIGKIRDRRSEIDRLEHEGSDKARDSLPYAEKVSHGAGSPHHPRNS